MRPLPIAFTRLAMLASAQLFRVVRSIVAASENAALISAKIGPEKLFSATVVRIVDTPKPAADLATRPAFMRRLTASIECVANAICDWWSIMISVWSFGFNRDLAGVGLAVGIVIFRGGRRRGGSAWMRLQIGSAAGMDRVC